MTDRLELRLPPDWDSVKRVWDPCMEFFQGHGLDADLSYSLSMSVQELMENAVKYGHYTAAEQIQVEVRLGAREVIIEVRHPVAQDASALRRLDQRIQWIRGYQTPFEAHVERLKEVSSRPYEPSESGLGLTRIAFEGQCILDFYVNEQNILALSAVFQRRAPSVSP